MPAMADLASAASCSANSVAAPNDNSVRAIKLKKSGHLTSTEKLALKELGPPRPELNIYQVVNACKNKKTYNRKFKQELYNLADWLCGCGEMNRFYCYWCLVMGVKDPSWTEEGFSDLKHLPDKIKKHKLSAKHIHAAIEFKILGRVAIRDQVDSAYRKRISVLNEQVSKNRYILSKLIDAVKFCGSFELAQDVRENTLNPGIFRGIVNLMADVDVTLKHHIETTNNQVFLGLSKTIQKELLDSILSVCHDIIRQELTLSEYIAIEVDETSDSATLSQLVFLVRYELNGVIRERFVNFLIPDSLDAEGISKAIFVELDKLGVNKTPDKLIAQCYDGSSVLSGQKTGVQARIKKVYKNANFVHCYAHQFNLIVERSTTHIKQVRLFFCNLEAFSSFFSQSIKRTAALDDVVKKNCPRNGATNLNFNFKSKAVETISKYHDEIDECLRIIVDDPSNDYSTVNKALGLQNLLDDKEEFMFWLNFFNKVMPHCDVLDSQLQRGRIDSINFLKCTNHFKDEITKLKNSPELDLEYGGTSAADCSGDARRGIARLFTQGITQCSQAVQNEQLSIKRGAKRQRTNDKKNIVAKEVCDLIMKAVNDRFGFMDHLSAGRLFEPSQFPNHTKKFPEKYLDIAGTNFQLNKMELRQELTVMYGRSDFFKAKGSLMLLNLIYDNNLSSVLPQSVKLLKIICTIPMTTAESERCFSTLKQVKTFTRSTMKEERLSALAMCSIEKELLASQKFNDRVMDHFSLQKDRQADFCFNKHH